MGGKNRVIVAHLLRRNNPDFAFSHFGLDATKDRDGIRNLMPLCSGLEDAFDLKRISFYQKNDGNLYMKVWDSRVRDKYLWKGGDGEKTMTIGDVEELNEPLRLPNRDGPYTRILAYHHRLCYYYAIQLGWINQGDEALAWTGTPIKNVPLEIEINSELDEHYSDQLSPISKRSYGLAKAPSSMTGYTDNSTENRLRGANHSY